MAREKVTPVVYASSSTFIDPINCGSMVSFKVIRDGYGNMNGDVSLTDCNRKIDWYFSNDEDSVPKIDAAIKSLREFRKAFIVARKANPKKTDA